VYLLPANTYCTYSIISRLRRLPNDLIRRTCTCLISNIPDIEQDCIQCGKRKHSFWDDTVGDILSYLCESRPWVEKIIVIAHNAKAFNLNFILNRAILLKWQMELIMNGMNIMCMRTEHLVFLDSISFLPFATCSRGCQAPSGTSSSRDNLRQPMIIPVAVDTVVLMIGMCAARNM